MSSQIVISFITRYLKERAFVSSKLPSETENYIMFLNTKSLIEAMKFDNIEQAEIWIKERYRLCYAGDSGFEEFFSFKKISYLTLDEALVLNIIE